MGWAVQKMVCVKGNEVEVKTVGENLFTFIMPKGEVKIKATFKLIQKLEGTPFQDVPASMWYSEAIARMYQYGLMTGVPETEFAPDVETSRAMIVTILYAMAGKPETENSYFADVPLNSYYYNAAAWAAENGIVSGYGNGVFGADDDLTREQLVMVMYSYAKAMGLDTQAQTELDFVDVAQLDSNAQDAMKWAYANGVISGKANGVLDPKGTSLPTLFTLEDIKELHHLRWGWKGLVGIA